jgi:hypothetical protein
LIKFTARIKKSGQSKWADCSTACRQNCLLDDKGVPCGCPITQPGRRACLSCAGVTAGRRSATAPGSRAPRQNLLTPGTGEVMLIAVQLARPLAARVIATTSGAAKRRRGVDGRHREDVLGDRKLGHSWRRPAKYCVAITTHFATTGSTMSLRRMAENSAGPALATSNRRVFLKTSSRARRMTRMLGNAAPEAAPHAPGFRRRIGDSLNQFADAVCRM